MNAIWNWLSGKKTIAGALAANIVPWFIIKGWLHDDTAQMVMGVINAVTGVGMVHKAVKSQSDA